MARALSWAAGITALALVTPLARAVNGDAFPDVVFANFNDQNQVCLGLPSGGFGPCTDITADSHISEGIALGDVNGDGFRDVVVANLFSPNQVCYANGSGGFSGCTDLPPALGFSLKVVLGDLNGDDFPDAIFSRGGDLGGTSTEPSLVCLNDGSGGFPACSPVDGTPSAAREAALGDLNGDGFLDVVFANDSRNAPVPDRVCLGDGSGGFPSCANVGTPTAQSESVDLGDLNGDHILDAVFAVTGGGSNQACLGNGSGGFSLPCFPFSDPVASRNGVRLGDANGDGNLDAIFATDGTARLCLGSGTGQFATPCLPVSAVVKNRSGVRVGDVNADGLLDAVFSSAQENELCTGNGLGVFTCSNLETVSTNTFDVALDAPIAPPTPPAPVLYFSFESTVSAGGLIAHPEDIVRFSQDSGYTMFFDGSDVGLLGSNVDAFEIQQNGGVLLSFSRTTWVPGIGWVEDEDIVRFTGTTGPHTSGTFTLFFDGDKKGLIGFDTDIDALAGDGPLYLSPRAKISVGNVVVQNEDVVKLDTATGHATLVFDGSAFGLAFKNLDALDVLPDGSMYMSFDCDVFLPGVGLVEDEDVVHFVPNPAHPATAGTFSLFFDGDANGITGFATDVDGFSIQQ